MGPFISQTSDISVFTSSSSFSSSELGLPLPPSSSSATNIHSRKRSYDRFIPVRGATGVQPLSSPTADAITGFFQQDVPSSLLSSAGRNRHHAVSFAPASTSASASASASLSFSDSALQTAFLLRSSTPLSHPASALRGTSGQPSTSPNDKPTMDATGQISSNNTESEASKSYPTLLRCELFGLEDENLLQNSNSLHSHSMELDGGSGIHGGHHSGACECDYSFTGTEAHSAPVLPQAWRSAGLPLALGDQTDPVSLSSYKSHKDFERLAQKHHERKVSNPACLESSVLKFSSPMKSPIMMSPPGTRLSAGGSANSISIASLSKENTYRGTSARSSWACARKLNLNEDVTAIEGVESQKIHSEGQVLRQWSDLDTSQKLNSKSGDLAMKSEPGMQQSLEDYFVLPSPSVSPSRASGPSKSPISTTGPSMDASWQYLAAAVNASPVARANSAMDSMSDVYSFSPLGETNQRAMKQVVTASKKLIRKISKTPYKVLDAPALWDDFYLNLVDWSSQNVIAVGLGSVVYLWSASTSRVSKLVDLENDGGPVCSVAWSTDGSHLAVGTNSGTVQVWDVRSSSKLRTMQGHKSRAGAAAWKGSKGEYSSDPNLFVTGSRDRSILFRDVRIDRDYVTALCSHRQEVCGLQWSPDEMQLASGGNDNNLLVWDSRFGFGSQTESGITNSLIVSKPLLVLEEHEAAVKAIGWSPHQRGLLVSGGGTADRTLRFWNTLTSSTKSMVSLDTGSQVCSLAWSHTVNEFVSSHGYSQNQIIVWRYPSLTKVATLMGHTSRVLHLSLSPTGENIVTGAGAGDETLRFWSVFPPSSRHVRHGSLGDPSVLSSPICAVPPSGPTLTATPAKHSKSGESNLSQERRPVNPRMSVPSGFSPSLSSRTIR